MLRRLRSASAGLANVGRISCGEAPGACGDSGTTLAATNDKSAGAICKRRDAVHLARNRGGSAAGRGKRPAIGFLQQLGRGSRPQVAAVISSSKYFTCLRVNTPTAEHSRCAGRFAGVPNF